MTVLVLMYHHTPPADAESVFDVPLPRFREQIGRLLDAGVPFITLQEAQNQDLLASRMIHVAVSFDDGHASNAAAFDYLAERGITATAFVVRDWVEGAQQYLSAAEIANLADRCNFGSHGVSHRNFLELSDVDLQDELKSSREFLQDIIGAPVNMLSLPGGRVNAHVLDTVVECGYQLVCNSLPLLNRRMAVSVNRICIRIENAAPDYLLSLVLNSDSFWALKRARYAATSYARTLMGDNAYSFVRDQIKSLLPLQNESEIGCREIGH